MSLVTVFIAVAIILGVGVSILGNASNGFSCTGLTGYVSTAPENSTGWAKACQNVASQSQESFNLLVVLLIVVAAVAILVVVRMLY